MKHWVDETVISSVLLICGDDFPVQFISDSQSIPRGVMEDFHVPGADDLTKLVAPAPQQQGEAASRYFTAESMAFICREVEKYLGQEILMGGMLDTQARVTTLTVMARGNNRMVPAVIDTAKDYDVVVHNHPSSFLKPSSADLYAAGVLSDYGVGFYIVTNDAERVNVVTKSQKIDNRTPHTLDAEAALKFLDPNAPKSRIAQELPSYVFRPNQADMMRDVIHAFNHNEIYICEAPTGTGKSLAYLLPAMLWAKTSRTKVVIATNTILLQEQLLKKDLALVRKLTGLMQKDLKVELVKGRQHYLCQRKFDTLFSAGAEELLFTETEQNNPDWLNLVNWGRTTERGEFNELISNTYQKSLKSELCCEVDTCKRKLCPHQHDDKCFYGNARKRFFDADILIVNHHILVIDLIIKARQGRHNSLGLLPAFSHLIVDEAHHLEDVALQHFGSQATRYGILKTLSHIATSKHSSDDLFQSSKSKHAPSTSSKASRSPKPRGALITIRNKLTRKVASKSHSSPFPTVTKPLEKESTGKTVIAVAAAAAEEEPILVQATLILKKLKPLEEKFSEQHFAFTQREETLFRELFNYLKGYATYNHTENPTHSPKSSKSPQSSQSGTYSSFHTTSHPPPASSVFQKRIKKSTPSEPHWDEFRLQVKEILDHLSDMDETLLAIHKCLDNLDEPFLHALDLEITINDFKAYHNRLHECLNTFAALLDVETTDEVKWLTGKWQKNYLNITAHCYKIDIKERLAKEFFSAMKTVVLTSATLTVKNSFNFFKTCMGFSHMDEKDDERICIKRIEPYFNYKENCGFYMPAQFPDVTHPNFTLSAKHAILEIVQFLGGRTLILFTSYRAMLEMKRLLAKELEATGICLMMQGDFDRYAMISKMKTSPNTVLMGVDSFWEGVDIRGNHLACLIMMKLPFPNFSEPLIEAQLEALERAGKSSFAQFSLPKAILKYRQGFGRLIRGETDRGLFVLLDRRLMSKSYGTSFTQSLPRLKLLEGETFTACAQNFWQNPAHSLQSDS